MTKEFDLAPTLVNFGGDISVTAKKSSGEAWKIKIEGLDDEILLYSGAVTTSGDKNKYIIYNDKKLPHILNPKTGWPVIGAPSYVTVLASSCSEAGALSTLALLNGEEAEIFLRSEAIYYRIQW